MSSGVIEWVLSALEVLVGVNGGGSGGECRHRWRPGGAPVGVVR